MPFHERRLTYYSSIRFLSYNPPPPPPEDDEDLAGSSALVLLLLHGFAGGNVMILLRTSRTGEVKARRRCPLPISTEAQKEKTATLKSKLMEQRQKQLLYSKLTSSSLSDHIHTPTQPYEQNPPYLRRASLASNTPPKSTLGPLLHLLESPAPPFLIDSRNFTLSPEIFGLFRSGVAALRCS